MATKTCRNCGAAFEVPYPSTRRKNCSDCRWAHGAAPRADAGVRKSDWVAKCCPCGKVGEVAPWRAPKPYYCSPQCGQKYQPPRRGRKPSQDNARRLLPDGYVKVYVPVGERPPGFEHLSHHPEHRVVMTRVLGRHLLPDENVHHVNGVKGDNRPENLELWTTKQPKGQRVADLLAFAHEVIERYEGAADMI